MLNDAEQELLRETTKSKLAKLDEDALILLHTRIRRARTKYVKLHRRRGASQVRHDRSRTRAAESIRRTAIKAEAFEEALGLVSARLAKVAADAAEAIKQERLAAAAKMPSGKPAQRRGTRAAGGRGGATATAARARSRQPIEKKRAASARSAKKRAQARRDAKR
jgi:hypothetical protein